MGADAMPTLSMALAKASVNLETALLRSELRGDGLAADIEAAISIVEGVYDSLADAEENSVVEA